MKFLHTYYKKILSILCIVIAALSFSIASVLVCMAAGTDSILDALGFGNFDMYVDDSDTFVHQMILNQLDMSQDEYTAYYFDTYYDFLLDDHWGLATGSGGIFDSTNNFNDAYLEAMGQQYEMFNTVCPFKWSTFEIYAKARRSAELSSENFNSTDYVDKNKVGPIQISGKGFKKVKDYWSEYYKPAPNVEQFIWSYQSDRSNRSDTSAYFFPLAPIYRSSKSWGGQAWSGVYVLPFVNDDFYSSTVYSDNYFYFYGSRDDDGTSYINVDVYSLSTDTLVNSTKELFIWGSFPSSASLNYGLLYVTNYSYFALRAYESDFNYAADKDALNFGSNGNIIMGKTLGNPLCYSGSLSNLKSVKFNNLYKATSFTPWNNKADDWGYIMSSEPFQLYGNQDKIDYDKIPDNYTITITGDTIYDYDITNPDTGEHDTIYNYVTNNYIFPENGGSSSGGGGSSSGGSSSGNVSVGGKVDVSGKVDISGKVEIDTKPIDINVNVNTTGTGGSGSSGTHELSGVEFDQDVSLNNYYDWMNEQTTGFSGFMKQFFSWLPDPIVIMLCAGFALVILARFLGR